ncbi:hypothetical protein J2Y68_001599 [Paenarthrobacter nitroguajacolicus]|nr:hypothetical protein [Paenarthrobacter nitroguajacolicus]
MTGDSDPEAYPAVTSPTVLPRRLGQRGPS